MYRTHLRVARVARLGNHLRAQDAVDSVVPPVEVVEPLLIVRRLVLRRALAESCARERARSEEEEEEEEDVSRWMSFGASGRHGRARGAIERVARRRRAAGTHSARAATRPGPRRSTSVPRRAPRGGRREKDARGRDGRRERRRRRRRRARDARRVRRGPAARPRDEQLALEDGATRRGLMTRAARPGTTLVVVADVAAIVAARAL